VLNYIKVGMNLCCLGLERVFSGITQLREAHREL